MSQQIQDPSAGGAPPGGGNYEFTGEDNASIEKAGTSASIWAMCAMVGALLIGTLAGLQVYLQNFRGAVLAVPLFLVCGVAGWLYADAGKSMKLVVNTEGNDVDLLMKALERMARAFRIEVIVMGIAVVVFAALAVASRMG